ncbi:hypothetical protein [Jannaschia marina]|uniref:hypothetical protein n=1 Tax=Jannaschia marina TaxID=2741674 RepID=UPI0015C98E83|nr:hypothetical protein [Jannaschia marina]
MLIRRSPSIQAYLTSNKDTYGAGWVRFGAILGSICANDQFLCGWRVHRSEAEGPSNEGIDPVESPLEAMKFYLSQGLGRDGIYSAAASRWIDGNFMARHASFNWGAGKTDRFSLRVEKPDLQPEITIDRFLKLIDLVLDWQPGAHIWCGDRKYVNDGLNLFAPDRVPAPWISWTDRKVPQEAIPSAFDVRPSRGGTLIVTTQDYWNVTGGEAYIERAHQVEAEMNEAGVLPRIIDMQ